jgi:predicted nuclease with TOPRIM domain
MDLATSMIAEQCRVEREKQQFVDDTNLKTATAISKVRKSSAEQVTKMKESVKEKDQLIGDLQDLAEGVAAEYSTLQRSALAVEEATKRTETTSKNRLHELKRLRDQNAELKSIIEEDREMMQANIVALSEENANLREQLHVKTEQLALTEHDLNEACEEIHVSDIAMCTFLNSYSLYFFHPSKKLTPHVIRR